MSKNRAVLNIDFDIEGVSKNQLDELLKDELVLDAVMELAEELEERLERSEQPPDIEWVSMASFGVSDPPDYDICPRCGANNQATHHFLCQSKDGTPTPYSDEEVKTMIRGLNLGLRHYGIRNPALAGDEIEF